MIMGFTQVMFLILIFKMVDLLSLTSLCAAYTTQFLHLLHVLNLAALVGSNFIPLVGHFLLHHIAASFLKNLLQQLYIQWQMSNAKMILH